MTDESKESLKTGLIVVTAIIAAFVILVLMWEVILPTAEDEISMWY